MSDAIQAYGLRKSFGKAHALNGLDLSVRTGEVHGFLGPASALLVLLSSTALIVTVAAFASLYDLEHVR